MLDDFVEPIFESILHYLAIPSLRGESHFSWDSIKSLITYFVTNSATYYVGCEYIDNDHYRNAFHILGTGIISPSLEKVVGTVSKSHLAQAMIADTLVTATGVLVWDNLLNEWWFKKNFPISKKIVSPVKVGTSSAGTTTLKSTDTKIPSSTDPSPKPQNEKKMVRDQMTENKGAFYPNMGPLTGMEAYQNATYASNNITPNPYYYGVRIP